jgi:DNA processing protein
MENSVWDDEHMFELALSFVEGIGPVLARNLVSYCGSPKAVFQTKKRQLERIPGIGSERAGMILRSDALQLAENEVRFMKRYGIQPLFFTGKDYPKRLRQCDDAPIVLFYKGNADLNPRRSLAIVGTRRISPYGKEILQEFMDVLCGYDVTIISGLAYGVDIVAHKEALRLGMPTVGVTAHGLDRLYPSIHRPVAERMLENGGILTEYPSGTTPDRDNFPARNRIVAGITDATVIIESAVKGGALITAEFANDYNREVFAFPGRINDAYSKGCNQLIKANKAMLIESAEHLIEAMNWNADVSPSRTLKQLDIFIDLSPLQERIVRCLSGSGWKHLDEIAWESKELVGPVSATLLELEFKGMVVTGPGKVFKLFSEKS